MKLDTHMENGWIYRVYRNHAAALICPFIFLFFFFLSNFQTLKIFVTLFSGTVRPRKLVHTWTVGRCIVCTTIMLLLHINPFIYSFFFLSNFQTLIFFFTLFSGIVRPRRLKLGTHMDSGQMYRVYRNQAAAAYSSFYFFNFSCSQCFVTLFSGTVRLRRLKLGTHMESATAAYSYLYFFIFLPLNFHFFLFLKFLVHNMSFSSDSAIAGL